MGNSKFIYKTLQECQNLEVSCSHFARESHVGWGFPKWDPQHLSLSRTFEKYIYVQYGKPHMTCEALKKAISRRGYGAYLSFDDSDEEHDRISGSEVFPVYLINGRPYIQTNRVWYKEGHIGFESLGSWLERFEWEREPEFF